MSPERRHAEEGIALISALFAVVVLLGLSVLFVATARFETRSSGIARDFELALHVAEGAAYDLIPSINADADGFTTTDSLTGDPHKFPSTLTAAQERQQAIDYAFSAASLVQFTGGEGYAMRPVDENGVPLRVIYAVGFVPERATPNRVRVLKMRFDALRYSPNFGLLTGGSLTVGGSATLVGTGGSIHSNGSVDEGSPGSFYVERHLTARGTVDPDLCADYGTSKGVQGECRGDAARQPIPEIDAREFYGLRNQAAAPWYDLCPPGSDPSFPTTATIHEPPTTMPGTPCTGSVIWAHETQSFLGWRFSTQFNEWRASNVGSGVFYVYQRNALVTGTQSTTAPFDPVTIIAEEKVGDASGAASGHVELRGNASMTSALSNVAIITDRDFIANATADVQGLVAANEQIDVTGNFKVTGAIVAQEEKDTPGSKVTASKVSGNLRIDYDGSLQVPLAGVIRITAWNEL